LHALRRRRVFILSEARRKGEKEKGEKEKKTTPL